MNIHDAIKNINNVRDDGMQGAVLELERRFGILTDAITAIILMEPAHYETRKSDPLIKLSKTGVLNFNTNLDYDILEKGMIPLFDMFDANYIVYRVKEGDFCVFDITSGRSSWATKDFDVFINTYF